ncbi:MAG: CRISPR-associated endonuclease Cas1 [Desulfobacteraceae bacterium]|nr:CRISPR-associated endonuclease Cas1 [Desulfobacteraceae bacterium]
METLYALHSGSYIRKDGDALQIMRKGDVIDRIPAGNLKKLILSGYVSLSGSVLDYLIKNRVETVFITPTGRFRARLMIDEHKHVAMRRDQYLRLSDPVFSNEVSKRIVFGKISEMIDMLKKRGKDHNSDRILSAAAGMSVFLRKLESRKPAEFSADELRGIEGAATRAYYRVFDDMIRNKAFSFNGRNRRPPRDPVNALLSFVYTMLTNEVLSAIKVCGLDPYMGSLHEIAYGRPSLACDLVEEHRCRLGDRFVLGLINRKMVRADDFVFRQIRANPENAVDEEELRQNRPVEMKPGISRTFIAAYENMMARQVTYDPLGQKTSNRRVIYYQVRRFAEFLSNPESGYTHFCPEK